MALITRRFLIGSGGAALIAAATPVSAAVRTPRQSQGPFYPDSLPSDSDNDLVRVAGLEARALGTVCHLEGQVTRVDGAPVASALVEIWQCDANGRYLHSGDRRRVARDPGFQGYGRTTTDDQGRYRFRTIKPVAYPGRAPHIHFRIAGPSVSTLVTQMYVAGAPENRRDGLLNSVRNRAARERLIVDLTPAPALEPDAVRGRFDIVLAPA